MQFTKLTQIKQKKDKHTAWFKITLLLTGSLTVLAGAVITAATPEIKQYFVHLKDAELFSKLILTLPALFIAIIAPVAGKIIDRAGRKKVLMVSLFLYALGGTSGLYLTNIYLILFGRAILGISVAGIMTINTTLIGDYFRGQERSIFMGWQGAFMGFGGVVYVSIGGILADISWRWPFAVYGFSIILLLLAWYHLYEPVIISKDHVVHKKPARKEKNNEYILLYVTAFMGMLFFYLIPTQVPFLLQATESVSNSTIGFSISIAILAGAFVAVNYGKIRRLFSFRMIFAITFVLMGAGYIIVSVAQGYFGILSGLIIAGIGTGLLMPNTNLWMVSVAPASRRGSLVGMLNLAVYSGQFLSPIAVYPLIKMHSIDFSFFLCGLIMIFMALIFYYWHVKIQKRRLLALKDK